MGSKLRAASFAALTLCAAAATWISTSHAAVFSAQDVLELKSVYAHDISPDGKWIAYTVRSMRPATDKAGSDYHELFVISSSDPKDNRPFLTGDVAVYGPRWSPDGTRIAFMMKRGDADAKLQVWMIPVNGGEATQVTNSKTKVSVFRWHPDGERILYLSSSGPTKKEKALKKKGYGFVYYEENVKQRNLHISDLDGTSHQITSDFAVWSFEPSPDGDHVAIAASDQSLIDQRYAAQHLYLLDLATSDKRQISDNTGKLSYFNFSPDGSRLVYVAAPEQYDHAVANAYVVEVASGDVVDVTPSDMTGNIDWAGWRDKNTVVYRASEGVWNTLNVVRAKGGNAKQILNTEAEDIVLRTQSYTNNFKNFSLLCSGPTMPGDLYHWTPGGKMKRLTNVNPWLDDRELGDRKVITYAARDGLEIEGLLYYPVGYSEGTRYPLIVIVHGGPESHYEAGWNTNYSRPTQTLTGKGYAVFMPNYRSSSGYGVERPRTTVGDPAGKEFDDIADGIDYLVEENIADPDRVGVGGGSYGGFAAAWFSSFYSDKIAAACMFVGISDLISKRGTTDIPYEELYVHSGKSLEDMWDLARERSPIYHAHKSKSAVLIYGGSADTRVHPSQSLEYYRRLKMNDHPAVRYVKYPGEGHGNAKQPGKIDVLFRTLNWYDWYVRDGKSIAGPMPPLDISDEYGIELPEEEKEEDNPVTSSR